MEYAPATARTGKTAATHVFSSLRLGAFFGAAMIWMLDSLPHWAFFPQRWHVASMLHHIILYPTYGVLKRLVEKPWKKWGSTCSIWSQTEEADVQLPSDLAKNHPAKGEDLLECNWTPGSLVSAGPRLNAQKEQVKRGCFESWIVKVGWFLWLYLSRWFGFEFAKHSFWGILSSSPLSRIKVFGIRGFPAQFHTFREGKPAFRFQRGRF